MRILIVTTCLLLPSCTAFRSRGGGPEHEVGSVHSDTALFAAVLRSFPNPPGQPLRVDPRPLTAAPTVAIVDRTTLDPDPVRTAAREAVLARLVLPRTDAATDGLCPGIMAVSAPKSACPATQFRSVIVGIPRAGGPYWPPSVDERGRPGEEDVWTVRVIARVLTPGGSAANVSDYVMRPSSDGRRWTLVRKRGLVYAE